MPLAGQDSIYSFILNFQSKALPDSTSGGITYKYFTRNAPRPPNKSMLNVHTCMCKLCQNSVKDPALNVPAMVMLIICI